MMSCGEGRLLLQPSLFNKPFFLGDQQKVMLRHFHQAMAPDS